MHTSYKHTFIATLSLAVMTFSAASADDHVIVEWTRSGMGGRYPSRSTEIWMNETSVYVKGPRIVAIERYDLRKRWRISVEKKRYMEDSLTTAVEQKSVKDTVAIQRAGWNYEPEYEWIVKETQREEVIGDQRCKLIVAEGDADYASESIELWVTESAPVNIARFNERVTSRTVDFDWQNLLKLDPALKKWFIVKSVDKRNPAIAQESSYETKVTKLEAAAPPPKIYEVPDGFQRVNSIEELIK